MAVREPARLSRLLRMAAVAGVASAVKIHIDRGDDLNARDENGLTPLMLSAAKNRAVVCELLIAAGVDIGLLDSNGNDALALALAASASEAAAVIVAARARPPIPDEPLLEEPHASPSADDACSDEVEPRLDGFPERGTSLPEDPRRLVVAFDIVESIDLGSWEAEEDSPPPADDPSLFKQSVGLQTAISEHRPVDTSADWEDFEAYLPEQASPLARLEDAETRERLRLLLLRALREGSVPSDAIYDLTLDDDRMPNAEAAFALRMVVNDLGAEADERFEYVAEHESFEVFVAPGNLSDEEDAVSEALALIDNLASRRNDPLRLYQKEFQRQALISGDQELALSQTMERAIEAALSALSSWPEGLERMMASSQVVLSGARPLRWMSDSARADHPPLEEQADVEASGDFVSVSAGDGGADDEERESSVAADEDEPSDELAEFRAKLEDLAFALESEEEEARHKALAALSLTRNYLVGLADVRPAADGQPAAAFSRAIADYLSARDKMAIANLKLVHSIALKYRYSGELLDDLAQEGNLGLLKAVDKFDWRKGFKFSTYATWWIRQSITRHIADKCTTIRLPVHVFEKTQRIARASREFEATNRHAPTVEQLEKILGEPVRKVMAAARATEETLYVDDVEDLDGRIAIDSVDRFLARDPESLVSDAQLSEHIELLLSKLTKKERLVLRMRFGIAIRESMSLEEVGLRFDVTRERIRQIEAKALRHAHHPSRINDLIHALGRDIPERKRKAAVVEEEADDAGDDQARAATPAKVRVSAAPPASGPLDRFGASRPHGNRALAIGKLLDEVRASGVDVYDDREGASKRVWVHLTRPSDGSSRTLVRKLSALGFEFWPGKGYWL